MLLPQYSRQIMKMYFSVKYNKRITYIIVCIILGAILRITYCWKYPVPVRDSFEYEDFIVQWKNTGEIPVRIGYPPLFMYIVKSLSEFFDYPIMETGIVINIIMGLGIIAVLMHISYLMTSSNLAVLCIGLFSATHYSLIQYSCQMTRENSYLLFGCLSFLNFLLFYKKRIKFIPVILCSIFVALACLCRHEALEIIIIYIGMIMLNKRITSKKKTMYLVFLCLTTAISFYVIVHCIGLSDVYYKQYFIEKYNSRKKSKLYESVIQKITKNKENDKSS